MHASTTCNTCCSQQDKLSNSLHKSIRGVSRPTHQSPEVDGVVVPFVQDDLRGEVVGGAADRPRVPGGHHLGQTEVDELDVALFNGHTNGGATLEELSQKVTPLIH